MMLDMPVAVAGAGGSSLWRRHVGSAVELHGMANAAESVSGWW